ncbi:MAG: hypothetical protein LBE20_06880 [Deltaproteobacteria bacterium]|jgi:hypothetical protein|nr:hypothetical protein [Deltaproteobacteria bacterium]
MSKTFNSSFLTFTFSLFIFFASHNLATAQTREKLVNNSERDTAAIGHFSRARALLIEALAEFELGKTISDPSLLLDTERWRGNIIVRAEELNRIIEPKPRITRSGIEYGANSQLVGQNRPSYKSPYVTGNKISKNPTTKKTQTKSKTVISSPAKIKSSSAQSSSSQKSETKLPVVQEENILEKEVAPIKKLNLPKEEAAKEEKAVEKIKELEQEISAISLENSADFGNAVENQKLSAETVNDADIEKAIEKAIAEKLNKN